MKNEQKLNVSAMQLSRANISMCLITYVKIFLRILLRTYIYVFCLLLIIYNSFD